MRAIMVLSSTGRQIPESEKPFWKLSAKLARKFHPPLKLYASPDKADLLINKWGIEFDEVDDVTIPRDTRTAFPMCWSAGKLAALREEAKTGDPFFIIDGDAFLTAPLKKELQKAQLFCQCIERSITQSSNIYGRTSHYPINELLPMLWMPEWMTRYSHQPQQQVINMGIFGGTDTALIHEYADIALKTFVQNDHNNQAFRMFYPSHPNFLGIAAISEQWSFGSFCHAKRIRPSTLMDRSDAFNISRMHEVNFLHVYSFVRERPEYLSWVKKKLRRMELEEEPIAA